LPIITIEHPLEYQLRPQQPSFANVKSGVIPPPSNKPCSTPCAKILSLKKDASGRIEIEPESEFGKILKKMEYL
jgi:hypothetical protein